MKKLKKVFAVLLTLAMVLGMSMTSFAADTGKIIINGLSANGTTTISVWKAAYLEGNGNEWSFADWAEGIIEEKGTITDAQAKALGDAAKGNPQYTEANGTFSNGGTTWTLENLPAGAYVITAVTTKDGKPMASYTTMVASTYSPNAGEVVTTAELTAKVSDFTLTKDVDANDKVAAYGEEISFTIQTTVPDLTGKGKYEIKDVPTGLEIKQVSGVKVGSEDITPKSTGYSGEEYVIDLSNLIPVAPATAQYTGKVLTISYTAEVTSTEGYSNTANYFIDDVAPGDGDSEEGYTGSITVTKVDKDDATVKLYGAKFEVTKVDKGDGETAEANTPLSFVRISDGVYRLAKDGEAGMVTEVEVAPESAGDAAGTVVIKGLEGGTYHFKETVAPNGYGVNDNAAEESMEDITITEANATGASVAMSGTYTNTKLGSLPETGGIGTTIFTIGGCVIMIAAAALFFASRRKSAK